MSAYVHLNWETLAVCLMGSGRMDYGVFTNRSQYVIWKDEQSLNSYTWVSVCRWFLWFVVTSVYTIQAGRNKTQEHGIDNGKVKFLVNYNNINNIKTNSDSQQSESSFE